MNRRNFIKSSLIGLGAVILPFKKAPSQNKENNTINVVIGVGNIKSPFIYSEIDGAIIPQETLDDADFIYVKAHDYDFYYAEFKKGEKLDVLNARSYVSADCLSEHIEIKRKLIEAGFIKFREKS